MSPRISASKKLFILPCAFLIAVLLSFTLAGSLNIQLLEMRSTAHLTQAPPTENMPPLVAFTTVALGGFRGVLADVLWMRAGTLQEEGRYFELVQLSDWIAKLQPRVPAIWAYHAWNMAYNISALMAMPEEKWRWVRNGIVLLRDEGMASNPGSARLHQELAWLFMHKLGSDYDPAARYYRQQWAAEVKAGAVSLNPGLVKKIDTEIAPLDWSTPQAQAIYWATAGLPYARTDAENLALRRIVYQSLLQLISAGDRSLLRPTIRYVEATQKRHPHIGALQVVLRQLQEQESLLPAANGPIGPVSPPLARSPSSSASNP